MVFIYFVVVNQMLVVFVYELEFVLNPDGIELMAVFRLSVHYRCSGG
jgi:hypothetical protein